MTTHEKLFLVAALLWVLGAFYGLTLLGAALALGGAVAVARGLRAQRQAGEVVGAFL